MPTGVQGHPVKNIFEKKDKDPLPTLIMPTGVQGFMQIFLINLMQFLEI
jgi:hypothetical protein